MASYKKVIDLYVLLQSRKPQADNTKKKQSQVMLLLVLLSLFPHTLLYFVLITSYAEKSVPGYNSISLKICFQLSTEFHDIPFNKIPPIFPKHAIFPTKLNVGCKIVVTVFMSYKYLLLISVKKKNCVAG